MWRALIGEHEQRITDSDVCVEQLSIWSIDTVNDGCTKDINVEVQNIGCISGSEHWNDSRCKCFR